MKILYDVGNDKFVVEATAEDLTKVKGDESYVPAVGDVIDLTAQWDAWLWIAGKKAQILAAGGQLTALGNKIPD